jgi:hypothetical protein
MQDQQEQKQQQQHLKSKHVETRAPVQQSAKSWAPGQQQANTWKTPGKIHHQVRAEG